MTLVTTQAELSRLPGFYRTPFGFYVADHKVPSGKTWAETADWAYRDGAPLIPNSYWSMVATLTDEDLMRIENPDIRRETQVAQSLMLEIPGQFVDLMAIGNRILIEQRGFGVKVLPHRLKRGDIKVYDHDVNKIVLGEPQEKYKKAKLIVDESAKENDIRVAVRFGWWYGHDGLVIDDRRFGVFLCYEPEYSYPAGLGFRLEGNQAYVDTKQALTELEATEPGIANARKLLGW